MCVLSNNVVTVANNRESYTMARDRTAVVLLYAGITDLHEY